jgi:hypothetical protein
MGKHILRKRLKKLFLFICIAAIVLSNFVSVIPVKAIQIEKPVDDTDSTVSQQAETTAEQETEKEANQSKQEDSNGSKAVNNEKEQAVKEEEQQPETEGIVQEDAQVDDKEQQEDSNT